MSALSPGCREKGRAVVWVKKSLFFFIGSLSNKERLPALAPPHLDSQDSEITRRFQDHAVACTFTPPCWSLVGVYAN